MSATTWIAVALIGGIAALARVSLDLVAVKGLARFVGGVLPALAGGIIVTGAFSLGLLDGLALSGDASIIVGTAGVGTFTTFSTWMLQTQVLAADGERRAALTNVMASLLVGFGAVALGRLIGT